MSKYKIGESGNPAGKKKGTLNKRTQLAKLLELHAEELINKVVELARNGDANALRLCIERLMPKARGEIVNITLPIGDATEAESLLTIGSMILNSVADQSITLEQGKAFADIVESQRKNIETSELAARVAEIEGVLKHRKTSAKLCKE